MQHRQHMGDYVGHVRANIGFAPRWHGAAFIIALIALPAVLAWLIFGGSS